MMRRFDRLTDRRTELVLLGAGLALAIAEVDLLRDHLSSRVVLVGDIATRWGFSGLGYRLW